MDSFLDLSDKSKFGELLDEYHLKKMRQKIYIHIINNNQNDFFDLELFNRNYVKNMDKSESFSEILIKELEPYISTNIGALKLQKTSKFIIYIYFFINYIKKYNLYIFNDY